MRRPIAAATLTLAALLLLPVHHSSFAQQGQLPLPPGGFKPPPLPPVKPYQAVAVTAPTAMTEPSFVAFRKQLADIATHKDRAGLAKLIVAQNFFWIQDKDLADTHKSGVDNLAKAIGLDAKDDSGWQILGGLAGESSAAESPQQQGVFCAPADPNIDPAAFETLGKATQTDPGDWGYPNGNGVEVHATAQLNSPVIEKLGMILVHVLPDSPPPAGPNDPMVLHVATPSGKTGFVDAQTLAALGGDQICYTKEAGAWKIAGYLGGASP
jgi:hypothetical protein